MLLPTVRVGFPFQLMQPKNFPRHAQKSGSQVILDPGKLIINTDIKVKDTVGVCTMSEKSKIGKIIHSGNSQNSVYCLLNYQEEGFCITAITQTAPPCHPNDFAQNPCTQFVYIHTPCPFFHVFQFRLKKNQNMPVVSLHYKGLFQFHGWEWRLQQDRGPHQRCLLLGLKMHAS